ncbi:unnamed protein product [Blepharisma stoltei]|uniref:C2H2-type domain-containing protein n=1 Tax=Blepharisma stoltei TaxID=1481888 RepID=A0AAU9IMB3_9CILI|nr:unnamed protein product [Blepharisma stoltei]
MQDYCKHHHIFHHQAFLQSNLLHSSHMLLNHSHIFECYILIEYYLHHTDYSLATLRSSCSVKHSRKGNHLISSFQFYLHTYFRMSRNCKLQSCMKDCKLHLQSELFLHIKDHRG